MRFQGIAVSPYFGRTMVHCPVIAVMMHNGGYIYNLFIRFRQSLFSQCFFRFYPVFSAAAWIKHPSGFIIHRISKTAVTIKKLPPFMRVVLRKHGGTAAAVPPENDFLSHRPFSSRLFFIFGTHCILTDCRGTFFYPNGAVYEQIIIVTIAPGLPGNIYIICCSGFIRTADMLLCFF